MIFVHEKMMEMSWFIAENDEDKQNMKILRKFHDLVNGKTCEQLTFFH